MYHSLKLLFNVHSGNQIVLDFDLFGFYLAFVAMFLFFIFNLLLRKKKLINPTEAINDRFMRFTKPCVRFVIFVGVLARTDFLHRVVQQMSFTHQNATMALYNLVFSVGRLIILVYGILLISFILKWLLIFVYKKSIIKHNMST